MLLIILYSLPEQSHPEITSPNIKNSYNNAKPIESSTNNIINISRMAKVLNIEGLPLIVINSEKGLRMIKLALTHL